MSLRNDILSQVLQETRPLMDTLGFRTNGLSMVVRTWTGRPGTSGSTYTDSTPLVIYPVPRIRAMGEDDVASSGGKYQDGDLRVDRLSPKHATGGYEVTDLRPIVAENEQIVYLVTGPNEGEFKLVDIETTHNFEYVLTLRRTRGTPLKGA